MNSKKTDIMVIGLGLAGVVAAARAAELGKKVLLVGKGAGSLTLSSGGIDLWGYSLDKPEDSAISPRLEIARLVERNQEHPYARTFDVLEESLAYFQALTRSAGLPYLSNGRGNWLVPTALGTLRPTYLVPESMAVTGLQQVVRILLVGFAELKDFYPAVMAVNLQKCGCLSPGVQLDTCAVRLGGREMNAVTLAGRLEQPGVLEEVVAQIRPHLTPGTLVLVPPVLGRARHRQVRESLAALLGSPVYEVAGLPPALPGMRLSEALLTYLKRQGVTVLSGSMVCGVELESQGKRCRAVQLAGPGGRLSVLAEACVLASGSFLGGGLKAGPGQVEETIFNLPVKFTPGDWACEEFLDRHGHAFNSFGLRVNEKLQPVDEEGRVCLENVLAAGAILAGSNWPVEKCGGGVALSSGYKAGQLAAGGV
ncbi:MAG: anaerobic glycerol-3-phosphate dehydrogenase subunit GlpB [Desulfurispora sp.]|uniref:anaerobic glycerol-3-phosphate dehydrogenase subunit GlpB n=1 Tax=Desulfurispora sp. TaxID=3014275 RepID=UPI0040499D59